MKMETPPSWSVVKESFITVFLQNMSMFYSSQSLFFGDIQTLCEQLRQENNELRKKMEEDHLIRNRDLEQLRWSMFFLLFFSCWAEISSKYGHILKGICTTTLTVCSFGLFLYILNVEYLTLGLRGVPLTVLHHPWWQLTILLHFWGSCSAAFIFSQPVL